MITEQELTTRFTELARREPLPDLPTAEQVLFRSRALAAWEAAEQRTKTAMRPALAAQLAALLALPAGLALWSLALAAPAATFALLAAALVPLVLTLCGPLLADR
jgi:hypothetical protein